MYRLNEQVYKNITKVVRNGPKHLLAVLELVTLESSLKVCLPRLKLNNSLPIIDLLKIPATCGILYSASSYVQKLLYNLVDFFSNDDLIFNAMTS